MLIVILSRGVMLRGGVPFLSETCFVRFKLILSPSWKGPPEVPRQDGVWPGSDPCCADLCCLSGSFSQVPLFSLFSPLVGTVCSFRATWGSISVGVLVFTF